MTRSNPSNSSFKRSVSAKSLTNASIQFKEGFERRRNSDEGLSIGECPSLKDETNTCSFDELIDERGDYEFQRDRMITVLSIIYAIFIVILGGLLTVMDLNKSENKSDETFM